MVHVWSPHRPTLVVALAKVCIMNSLDVNTLAKANVDPDALLNLARRYEDSGHLVPTFGYYLIATSLKQTIDVDLAGKLGHAAHRIGDQAFALRCFASVAAREKNNPEGRKAQAAISNIIKTTGVTVTAAEISAVALELPALLETIPGSHPQDRRQCLLINSPEDTTENILLSLQEHSVYNGMVFRYAEIAKLIPNFNIDLFLFIFVQNFSPDLVLLRHASLTTRSSDPRVETLLAIRDHTNIPVMALHYDIIKPSFQRLCRAYLPGLDGVVTTDSPFEDLASTASEATIRFLWTPLPKSLYWPTDAKRRFDIGFVGRDALHYQQRRHYLNGLREAGTEVTLRGHGYGEPLSIEAMVEFLRSCKIVLNFSATAIISPWERSDNLAPGFREAHHVKVRVFEAIACGALLFESRNGVTPTFFKPGEHYVEFSSLPDLREKLTYYLENVDARQKIARAGTEYYQAHYSGERFWRAFEDIVGDIRERRNMPTP